MLLGHVNSNLNSHGRSAGTTKLFFVVEVIIKALSVVKVHSAIPRTVAMIHVAMPCAEHVIRIAHTTKLFDVLSSCIENSRKNVKFVSNRVKLPPRRTSLVSFNEYVDSADQWG